MSDGEPKIVRYTRKPLTAEQIARLKAVADLPDDQIDFSDIPPLTDAFFENAVRGMFYRPLKKQLTLRIDADLIEWFKSHADKGKGYQTKINQALREYVAEQEKKAG